MVFQGTSRSRLVSFFRCALAVSRSDSTYDLAAPRTRQGRSALRTYFLNMRVFVLVNSISPSCPFSTPTPDSL
jgi:hypothetical protein